MRFLYIILWFFILIPPSVEGIWDIPIGPYDFRIHYFFTIIISGIILYLFFTDDRIQKEIIEKYIKKMYIVFFFLFFPFFYCLRYEKYHVWAVWNSIKTMQKYNLNLILQFQVSREQTTPLPPSFASSEPLSAL